MGTASEETQTAKVAGEQTALVAHWLQELQAADEREKDYRRDAKEVVEIYEAEKQDQNAYNILFANTETLQPALYSRLPRPVVRPRPLGTKDPIKVAIARVVQQELQYFENTDLDDYPCFDDLIEQAVLEALVPGRGVTRFKYDADVERDADGKPTNIQYEAVCGQHMPWDRFKHGYAKQWKDVPWISYDHFMTPEELLKNFGKDIADKMQLSENEVDSEQGKSLASGAKDAASSEYRTTLKLAYVAEIWDKTTKRQLFISPNYKEGPLKTTADPLGLTGFFPQPEPLRLFRKVKTLIPTPLYHLYRAQAVELNNICTRIIKLINALKVRGVYDGRIKELGEVFTADDNTMTAAESMESLGMDGAGGGGLDKAIWTMPIEKIVVVLQQLFLQREATKRVIHELTGIADIMRGSTQASETLGAQQIKERWGGVRLKRMQRRVARYINDCQRIMAEIATKLQPATIKAISGLPFPMAQEKQAAQQLLQAAQQSGQQPPPQAVMAAQMPSFDEIQALLQKDRLRSYSIDIETNSTVELELTEDKKDISEMMAAMGQFMSGIGPLVKDGALPFDGAKAMLLAISRRFRFGEEVEDTLRGMQAPKPENENAPDPADMAKVEIEKQKAAAAHAESQERLQMDKAKMTFDQKLAQEEAVADFRLAQQKLSNELTLGREKLAQEADLARQAALADGVRQEREGQRQRAIDKSKESMDTVKLVKEMQSIVTQHQTAMQGQQNDQVNKGMETTMKALTSIVDKLANANQSQAKTLAITIQRDPKTDLATGGTVKPN